MIHTFTVDNDNVTTSIDSDPHAIVNRVINLTNATDVSTPVLLSKMHYRDVLIQELNCNAVALEPQALGSDARIYTAIRGSPMTVGPAKRLTIY